MPLAASVVVCFKMEAENDKSISFSDESDWKESKTDSGRTFYVNRQTGQTAWAIGPLPVGWSAREDAVGRIYFIDHATNRKTFNDPRLDPNLNRPAVAASRPVALNSIAQRWVGLSTKRSSMQFIPGLYKSYLNVSVSHGEQIERDLGRTNPTSPYFDKNGDGKGLQQLKNVLCAWALHDPEIGYVQGMNFIVGYLLQQTRNEEQTFWLFARLLQSEYYGVRGMFVDGLPKLWSMCYQVQRGMQRLCPKLAAHFARLKLTGTAWLPQWTMSLFTKYADENYCDCAVVILIRVLTSNRCFFSLGTLHLHSWTSSLLCSSTRSVMVLMIQTLSATRQCHNILGILPSRDGLSFSRWC